MLNVEQIEKKIISRKHILIYFQLILSHLWNIHTLKNSLKVTCMRIKVILQNLRNCEIKILNEIEFILMKKYLYNLMFVKSATHEGIFRIEWNLFLK